MTVPIIFHVSYTLLNTTDNTRTRMGAHPPWVDLNYFILSYSPSSTSSNISRKVFILYVQVLQILSYYTQRILYYTQCGVLYTEKSPGSWIMKNIKCKIIFVQIGRRSECTRVESFSKIEQNETETNGTFKNGGVLRLAFEFFVKAYRFVFLRYCATAPRTIHSRRYTFSYVIMQLLLFTSSHRGIIN